MLVNIVGIGMGLVRQVLCHVNWKSPMMTSTPATEPKPLHQQERLWLCLPNLQLPFTFQNMAHGLDNDVGVFIQWRIPEDDSWTYQMYRGIFS